MNTAAPSAPPALAFEQEASPTTEATSSSTTTTAASPNTTATTEATSSDITSTAAADTTTTIASTTTIELAPDAVPSSTADVWVIGLDVQAGQATGDLFAADVFKVASVPEADIPANAIFDLARIQGLIAAEDIPSGSVLTEGQFVEPVFAMTNDAVVYQVTTAIPRGTPLDSAFDDQLMVRRAVSDVGPVPDDAIRDILAELDGGTSPIATVDIRVGSVIVEGHFEEFLPFAALEIAYLGLQDLPDLPASAGGTGDGFFVHFDLADADTDAETVTTSAIVPALTEIGFRSIRNGKASLMVYGTCGFAEVVQTETDRVEVSLIDGC